MLILLVSAVAGARPAPAAAATPSLIAYRGLGTWVDLYDGAVRADPEAAVAQMRAAGVHTLYLETSSSTAGAAVADPRTVERFVVAAHAAGMRVVAWYLPTLGRPALDKARARAAIRFRTAGGEAFDAFALDVESAHVRDVHLRTQRVLALADAVRATAGPGYPLGAIVPAPEGMRLNPSYWPGFPFRALRARFDVFLPMGYFTYHTTTAAGAYTYTSRNIDLLRAGSGDPAVPVHLVGGLAADTTLDELTAFLHAGREHGVLGASMYDFATTPSTWWPELANLPANPRQRPPLPLTLPGTAALGNIPGGDRTHPKEVFYRTPALSGSWELRYRGYDLGTDEVELWVNWQKVRTFRAGPAGGWSPWRHPLIPDGLLHSAAPNVIQVVAAGDYPAWSVWGVEGVSLVKATTRSPARSG